MTLSTGARWLKRGDTFDPEDHRMTHRLRVARGFLASVGIKATVEHCELCSKHPSHAGTGMYETGCWDRCVTSWPEWVTDDMFNYAFQAADALQTLRGLTSQAQINAQRAAPKV